MSAVTKRQVVAALEGLREDRWPEMIDFIDFLAHHRADGTREGTPVPLANGLAGLVGLWGTRTDIVDAPAFARALRQRAQREREGRKGRAAR